jgi:hypothetical protein
MKALLAAVLLPATVLGAQTPAFHGAIGFGAFAKGGAGGRVIEVTRLDDQVQNPPEGSFRWAVGQSGPRMVRFSVAGTIRLADEVTITEPFLTIDGRDAPGKGVCLSGGSLELKDTHDVIIRHIRVRLGDETTKRKNQEQKLKRPKNSNALDCISLSRCRDVLIDHVSASWSCDEIFSVVRCRNVTVQNCLISEPLSNPELHPYGDNHAFCFNASASTLTVANCLFARYVMRGPQFEANDMRRGDDYAVQMEAVNNIMFDYHRSGSRYTTGIEDHKDEAAVKGYQFQVIANSYRGDPERPAIEAVMKHEVHGSVRAFVDDPQAVQLSDTKGREALLPAARDQLQPQPLFTTSATNARMEAETLLDTVGCSHARDSADQRIIADVRARKFGRPLRSQTEVGGWPELQ